MGLRSGEVDLPWGFMKPPYVARFGGVVSEHPLASKIGIDVLSAGGNAVDAAVAVSLVLAVTQPHLSGLGGDFVALVYDGGNGRVSFINGTGWAPRGLSKELLANRGLSRVPVRGPLSPVVPGFLAGLHELWRRFGSMEWNVLVKPASRVAMEGYPASRSLVDASRSLGLSVPDVWGIVRLPGLGKALELIAEGGIDAFYRGEIGEALVDHLNSLGGVMSMDDLKEYSPEWGSSITIEYRNHLIHETPPNTQGVTTLILLNLLRDIEPRPSAFSAERIRRYVDLYRIAYSLRDKYVGDPRFVDVPINELLRSRPTDTESPRVSGGDTTYFVVADSSGNVVSAIQSLYHHFGSMVIEPKFNIVLNNRASDFSMEGPNELAPRKRPLHTLSTVIVEGNGGLRYALGTSGGHFRPQQHLLMITNLLDYSMNPVDAIDAPRFLWDGSSLIVEEGFNTEGIDAKIVKYPSRMGVAGILSIRDGWMMLYADPRGEGLALGADRLGI